jgi:hypothetical protein
LVDGFHTCLSLTSCHWHYPAPFSPRKLARASRQPHDWAGLVGASNVRNPGGTKRAGHSEVARAVIAWHFGGACTNWINVAGRTGRWRCCNYQGLAAWHGIVSWERRCPRHLAAVRQQSPVRLGCSTERFCRFRRPCCRAAPAQRSNRRSSDDTSGVDATGSGLRART